MDDAVAPGRFRVDVEDMLERGYYWKKICFTLAKQRDLGYVA